MGGRLVSTGMVESTGTFARENKDGIPSIISGLSPEAQAQFKSAVLIISIILLLVGFLCLILFGLPIAMRGIGWEQSAEKLSAITSGIKAKIKK